MTITETMWLRGQAAQRDMLTIASYGTVFVGTAAVQAVHFGLTAPQAFWAAMGRAAGSAAPPSSVAAPVTAETGQVVQLVPSETVADGAAPETSRSEPPPAPIEVEPERRPEPTEVGPVQNAIDAPASAPVPHVLGHPRGGAPDDLTALTGVGEKLAKALNAAGIYHFDQIAALDEEAIAWLETRQKGFRMTCARHDLVGQAKARA